MKESAHPITPARFAEVLLRTATARPVHIWGPPGVGKSSLVEQFAFDVGLECISLLGTQLAPEDISGVPQIVTGADGHTRSRFAPPEAIARTEPFVLFLDELNASSPEVQKAFYQIVLDKRIGAYPLPEGTIIIAAGNRDSDNAIVRPMSSALVNRFLHLHLRVSASEWLAWAAAEMLHPWVIDYIKHRPDHLWVKPPKVEEPFSTPRSWHALSDVLHSWGPEITEDDARILAHGQVSPQHAISFVGFVRARLRQFDLDPILKGDASWPAAPSERDVLHFLALSLRARLAKELPGSRSGAPATSVQLAHRGKQLIAELAEISVEYAQLVVAGDGGDRNDGDGGGSQLPAWFLTEVVRDLPRLVG